VVEDLDLMADIRKEMELPEGVLVTNLFVPCMVLCSKVDLIEHGEKDIKDVLERNLDFIQVSLRKFCLSYGAGLVFSSSNSNCNI
jgi:dynein light intermediate chain 1